MLILLIRIVYIAASKFTCEDSLDYVRWGAVSDEGKSEQTTEIENYEVYLENKAVQPEWSTWRRKGG